MICRIMIRRWLKGKRGIDMKKRIGAALLIAICICMSACNGTKISVQLSEQSGTSATEITNTVETTAKEPEPPTVVPEELKKSAYREYLSHLQHYSAWFTLKYFDSANGNRPIAVYDIDGNGIPELLYVHPAEDQSRGEIHFSIYTYADGALQKLYEDYIFGRAGAEPYCFIFIGDDGALYSESGNGYNNSIIRYHCYGNAIRPEYLGYCQGNNALGSDSAICHVNSDIVPLEEYTAYKAEVLHSATTFLVITGQNPYAKPDLSLSYDDAYAFLSEDIAASVDTEPTETSVPIEPSTGDKKAEWDKKYGWKKAFYQFLDEVDDSKMSGYQIVYIDEDDTPELIAVGVSHLDPSYLCWVHDGELCKAPISYSGFSYLEKQNLYLCEEGRTEKGLDYIRRINGSQAENVFQGEFCTVKGQEYYRWNGTDCPDKSAYNADKNAVYNTYTAKKVAKLKSYRDIRFWIKDFI